MKRLILGLLFLTACGPGKQDINKEFKTYFDDFVTDAQTYANLDFSKDSIQIKFGEFDCEGETYACTYLVPERKIIVDKSLWDENESETIRKEILYHQFGHAFLLRLSHKDDVEDGVPVSLMHTSILIPEVSFLENLESYLQELFE